MSCQIFGKLSKIGERGGPRLADTFWLCRCSCGQEREFPARAVKYGEIKSCGCLSRKPRPPEIGNRKNHLVVLEVRGKTVFCRCDCGKEVLVSIKGFKSGNNKSCGCLRGMAQCKASLALTTQGMVFGRLTVLENLVGKCRCRCDHGGKGKPIEIVVSTRSLRNGGVQSCGCFRRERTAELRRAPLIPAGTLFGRLTVLKCFGPRTRCQCVCGKILLVVSAKLRNGHTQSCGCLQRERAGRSQVKEIAEGTQFGRLTVLRTFRGEGGGLKCICRCACAAERELIVDAKKLRNGHTQSCGCLRDEVYRISAGKNLPPGCSADRELYCSYRTRAAAHGVLFDLSRAQFRALVRQPCCYCGRTPSQEFDFNGIDRRDNNLGYTESNSVACCNICNRAKFQMTETAFLNWVSSVGQLFQPLSPCAELPSSIINSLFGLYKRQAEKRSKTFTLTPETVSKLVCSPCSYCGSPPANLFRGFCYNGIDRLSSVAGYSVENSVTACKRCNRAKGQLSVADFLAWAARVVKFKKLPK
jgi:hypothetical protein